MAEFKIEETDIKIESSSKLSFWMGFPIATVLSLRISIEVKGQFHVHI
jgi:hypothetical protein